MKGNNGKAARKKLLQRIAFVLGGFGLLLSVIHLGRRRSSSSDSSSSHQHPHPRDDDAPTAKRSLFGTGDSRLRRTKDAVMGGGMRWLTENDPLSDPAWQDILQARVHLVDLIVKDEGRLTDPDADDGDYSYRRGALYGVFCRVNWALHKSDPSTVPMFRDLVDKSPDCSTNRRIKVDLALVVEKVAEFDQELPDNQLPRLLELTAVVFHESRCGSTLVANLLAAMSPTQNRVYSESPPPVAALRVCGDDYTTCPIDTAARVLQDVLYLMGRSDDSAETRVFFKIQSVGSRNLPVFQAAFPETPWLFVYRDPVQVMMSQMPAGMKNVAQANCVRPQKSHYGAPESVARILHRHFPTVKGSAVSAADYCAAHLASITETAVAALQSDNNNGMGIPVNYRDLPAAFWQRILPEQLHLHVSASALERMHSTSGQYSKGRANTDKRGEFRDDSRAKEKQASPEIRQAAQRIMQESYDALEEMAAAEVSGNGVEEE